MSASPDTNSAMSAALQGGGSGAVDSPQLVAQMRPALVNFFRRKTGSAAEAEDLAQDVLLRALSHAGWESAEHAKGYIFRAAVNRWNDRCRREQTRNAVAVAWDEALQEHPDTAPLPDDVLSARHELALVMRALDEVGDRTRSVLLLIKVRRMRIAAVAERLGISQSAVSKHLARGLAHLAQLRRAEGDASR